MRCDLSRVTTRRSWLISFTVRVLGTSTSMPDWRMGAVIIKMMSSTSTTSTNGTMLISESEVCVDLESCIYFDFSKTAGSGRPRNLIDGFFDQRSHFQRKRVQALSKIANVLQKMVIENDGGNRGKQAGGSGHERLSDAGSDGTKAGSARAAEAGKGINDAPNGSEETDERRYRARGGKPGHSLFHAADFFGGSKLHIDGHGLQTLEFWGMRIAGDAPDLALQFAIARGIDVGERRSDGHERLRIGDAPGGAENAQELVAFPPDAAEHPQLLQNHGPGNNGKEKQKQENDTRNQTGLLENLKEISDKNRSEQKNDVPLSGNEIFSGRSKRSTRVQSTQQIGCKCF